MTLKAYSVIFAALLISLFIWAAVEAASFQRLASYFPLYISIFGAILNTYILILELKARSNSKELNETSGGPKEYILYMSWFTGYFVAIYLVGMVAASMLFLFFFLRYESKQSLLFTIISMTLVALLLIGFSHMMNLNYPKSLFPILEI